MKTVESQTTSDLCRNLFDYAEKRVAAKKSEGHYQPDLDYIHNLTINKKDGPVFDESKFPPSLDVNNSRESMRGQLVIFMLRLGFNNRLFETVFTEKFPEEFTFFSNFDREWLGNFVSWQLFQHKKAPRFLGIKRLSRRTERRIVEELPISPLAEAIYRAAEYLFHLKIAAVISFIRTKGNAESGIVLEIIEIYEEQLKKAHEASEDTIREAPNGALLCMDPDHLHFDKFNFDSLFTVMGMPSPSELEVHLREKFPDSADLEFTLGSIDRAAPHLRGLY